MADAFDTSTEVVGFDDTTLEGPAGLRGTIKRAGARVALMVVAAAAMYGAWAAYVNLAHGPAAALRAGLVQGASSGTTTLVIGSILEALHATLPARRHRVALATLIAASTTALFHLGLHLAAGTPEIVRTILPSVVLGYGFAFLYARGLEGPRLRFTYHRPADLSARDREAIWALLSRSVERERDAFEEKLARTQEVFLGHTRTGALAVFGALAVLEANVDGRTETLIYTHWAVIHPEFRGSHVIQHVGFRRFLRERLRHPWRRIHWVFTASTFPSYVLLARNFGTYWPRPEASTPPRVLALLDRVMREVEQSSWDADAGVLRRNGASRYREGIVDDDPAILDHPVLGPAVRYYRGRNPGQRDGDSLACLCPLTVANWWSCLRVAMVRTKRRRAGA